MQKYKLGLQKGDEVPDSRVEADHVLETEPPAEARVREGSTIVAKVSTGPSSVQVPDLTGMTPDSARSMLEKLGLTLDDEMDRLNKPPAKDGTILDQSPKKNASVAREGKVRVTVQDDAIRKPDVKPFRYSLNVDLATLTDRTRVKIVLEGPDGKEEVENRRRAPGETVRVHRTVRAEEVTWRIYYDDQLVKTVVAKSDGTTESAQ